MSNGKIFAVIILLLLSIGIGYSFYTEFTASHNLVVVPRISLVKHGVINIPSAVIYINNPTNYDFEVRNIYLKVYLEGYEIAEFYKSSLYIPAHSRRNIVVNPKLSNSVDAIIRGLISTLEGRDLHLIITGRAEIPIKIFNIISIGSITVPISEERYIPISSIILSPVNPSNYMGSARVSIRWFAGYMPVTEVRPDTYVTAIINVAGYRGELLVEIRQDRRFLPDKTVASKSVYCSGQCSVRINFLAEDGITVRGYFVRIRGAGLHYEQPAEYPPRLRVNG